jgi:hypothetical protein
MNQLTITTNMSLRQEEIKVFDAKLRKIENILNRYTSFQDVMKIIRLNRNSFITNDYEKVVIAKYLFSRFDFM